MSLETRAAAYEVYEKDRLKGWIDWTLWFFLGGFGGHRFYMGHTSIGLAIAALTLLTGLGLIWSLIHAFFLNEARRKQNRIRWNLIARGFQISEKPVPASASHF